MNKLTKAAEVRHDGIGILNFLSSELGLSATLIKKVKYGGVFVNGVNVHMRHILYKGDKVEVYLPESVGSEIAAIEMPLDIIYEDDDIIAVNKPQDMPTHPSKGNSLPTLAEGIMAYFGGTGFVFRAVNRLDRDTSGIVLIAKNAIAAARLSENMKRGDFSKTYIAVVDGVPEPKAAVIDAPIEREAPDSIKRTVRADGKRAITEYRVLRELKDGTSLVEITLHTGRTHQIRVHMAHIGHPLTDDFLYGRQTEGNSYKLHATRLSFTHPTTKERITLECRAEFESYE